MTNPPLCSVTTLLINRGNDVPRTIRRISSHDLSAYPLPPSLPSRDRGRPARRFAFHAGAGETPAVPGDREEGELESLAPTGPPCSRGRVERGHGMARNMGFA